MLKLNLKNLSNLTQLHTVEEIDFSYPYSNGIEGLTTIVYFDSNFAHDKVTRPSVTGIMVFVGTCPVYCASTRHGPIDTRTFGAELCAVKVGVEENINIHYML